MGSLVVKDCIGNSRLCSRLIQLQLIPEHPFQKKVVAETPDDRINTCFALLRRDGTTLHFGAAPEGSEARLLRNDPSKDAVPVVG